MSVCSIVIHRFLPSTGRMRRYSGMEETMRDAPPALGDKAVARLLAHLGAVPRIADRRHRHDQSRAEDPGHLGSQSAYGVGGGQARTRLVAADAHRRRLSMRRCDLPAATLADRLRGLGLRPPRARQHQPLLSPLAVTQPTIARSTMPVVWQR